MEAERQLHFEIQQRLESENEQHKLEDFPLQDYIDNNLIKYRRTDGQFIFEPEAVDQLHLIVKSTPRQSSLK